MNGNPPGVGAARPGPGGRTGRRGPGTADAVPNPLFRVTVKDTWQFLLKQPLSYWLVCTYLFFEYVRPQSIYSGIAFFPWSQAVIILCLIMLVIEQGMPKAKTVASGLMLVFTAIVLISSMTARRPEISWAGIDLYLSWLLIYFLIINTVNTEGRYFVFLLSFLLYSLKMSQHGTRVWMGIGFGFQDWGASGAPGWFQNSGEFGIQMCVFLPLALHFIFAVKPYIPTWKLVLLWSMPLTAVASMVGSSSRGAVLGGGLVGVWMAMRSKYRIRAGVGFAVVGILVFLVIPPEQKERFSTMGDDGTSITRLTMWKDGIRIANENPIFGIGYDNWSDYYMTFAGTELLPHNIFIEALTELGYGGLIGFLLLIGATFFLNAETRRLMKPLGEGGRFMTHSALGLDGALVGYIGSGFFVTVLYYPYFWINLAMTTGLYLAALRKAKKEVPVKRPMTKAARAPRLQKLPVG